MFLESFPQRSELPSEQTYGTPINLARVVIIKTTLKTPVVDETIFVVCNEGMQTLNHGLIAKMTNIKLLFVQMCGTAGSRVF